LCTRVAQSAVYDGRSASPLASMNLISTFMPLLAFVVAVVLLVKRLDAVARRVAPDFASGGSGFKKKPAPRGALGWLRRLGEAIVLALVLVFWIRGSVSTRYALIALISVSFFWISYKNRLRPLFARGANARERSHLLALSALATAFLGYALFCFSAYSHAG
jgi:hypothetical protein